MTSIPPEPIKHRGRFAPSPTGPLHMGSLVAALGSWLMARHRGGEWLLRVEDVDPPRELPGSARHQISALAALGLVPDGPIVWQGERSEIYAQALDVLVEKGLAFECRCSRGDLSANGGIHRECVARPSGNRPAFRLRVPELSVAFDDLVRGPRAQWLGTEVGDYVIKRADGYWAYQLAVVVDDALQAITEVVRGADLLDSTPRQIFLQRSLGYATPSYAHLPVIRQADGHKLGKSLRSAPFDLGRPLAALGLAYGWLGQETGALDGAGTPERALVRALDNFRPERIPAADHILPRA